MCRIRLMVLAVLAVALTCSGATPAFAGWGVSNSEKPGSVLVFPKFIRGTFTDFFFSNAPVHARTELEISVRCPDGASCAANQVVRMRANWVCPGCNAASFDLETTVNGSLYFNTEGVTNIGGIITATAVPSNATTTIPVPPCARGYLIVWVVDGNGAIKFDGLIGDAIIREAPDTFRARAYNAIPIQANYWLNTGDSTDADGEGDLDFNASEYQMVTGRIFGTVRYENPVITLGGIQTDLTLLTLDVAANRPNPLTTVGLNFYTTEEGLVDTATNFLCWSEQRLIDINPSLTQVVMGRKGLVESTYAEQQLDFFTTRAATLLGIIETKEFDTLGFLRDYSYSLYNDGVGVETTYKP